MFKSLVIQFKKDPIFVLRLIINYFNPNLDCKATFLSEDNLLEKVREGKNIIRIGDGDLGIIHGKSIFHQKYNKNLEKDIKKIITDYSLSSNYILLIPRFINISNSILRKKEVLTVWLPFKLEFLRSFNKGASYGDAHIFYYLDFTKKLFLEVLKDEELLFVTNSSTVNKIKNNKNLPQKSISFIEIPDRGTYEQRDLILKNIKSIHLNNKNIKVILACGSTSRVLAYECSKIGIHALDIGRGISCILEDKDYSYTIWATKITEV